ncbi:hypothetical protein DLE03_00805 [Actinobacteria bacterium IMCC25003]|nr:hypothetical protein DLE03_00805 [Actinobacteria bacterium IMCC25003]
MSNMWEEIRPSRLRVLLTYTKRAIRWRRNSAPYLSGDLFSDMSDVSMYPPRFRGKQPDLDSIRAAKVIFCPSDKLQDFFMEFHDAVSARVIICGNSDHEFKELPENIPGSVKQLFLQNSFISDHPLVTTLPIGVENFRWGVNGNPRNLTQGRNWPDRKNEILIGPLGLTHPIRLEVRNNFSIPAEGIKLIQNRLEPARYARLARETRYVAAIRGNGVDTHRHWETLYRGGIPLILRDAWSDGIKGLRLPFIEVDAWDAQQLHLITANHENLGFNPAQIPALWWPYWKEIIASYL